MVFIKNVKRNIKKELVDEVLEEHGLITKAQRKKLRQARKKSRKK